MQIDIEKEYINFLGERAKHDANKKPYDYSLDDEGWNSELSIECIVCEEQCWPEVHIQISEDGRERAFTSCSKEGRIHVEDQPEVKEMIKRLKEKK